MQVSEGTLRDVQVESGPGNSLVRLVGPGEPVFTAFQQTDPDRLIIDLAATDQRFCIDDVHRQRGIQSLAQLFVVHAYAVAVDLVERGAEQDDNCQHCSR